MQTITSSVTKVLLS